MDVDWQRRDVVTFSPFLVGLQAAKPDGRYSGGLGFSVDLNPAWIPFLAGVPGFEYFPDYPFGAINVNAIVPGYIATKNTEPLRNDPVRSKSILERIPAGRWGKPSDLAGITVFLASRASDYCHGGLYPVDGGWLGR